MDDFQFWSFDERIWLKKFNISQSLFPPEKLKTIVQYFKDNGSVYGITGERYYKNIRLSKQRARDFRDLVKTGELDWVLKREKEDSMSNWLQVNINAEFIPVTKRELKIWAGGYERGYNKARLTYDTKLKDKDNDCYL
jgi:hypothetical protein